MSAARVTRGVKTQRAGYDGHSASVFRACEKFLESRGERKWGMGVQMRIDVMQARGVQNRRDKADDIARELEEGWNG